MNSADDVEFMEFVMNSEKGLNLDKSIFKSSQNVKDFCNACKDMLLDIGVQVDGDVVVVFD